MLYVHTVAHLIPLASRFEKILFKSTEVDLKLHKFLLCHNTQRKTRWYSRFSGGNYVFGNPTCLLFIKIHFNNAKETLKTANGNKIKNNCDVFWNSCRHTNYQRELLFQSFNLHDQCARSIRIHGANDANLLDKLEIRCMMHCIN